MLDKLREHLLAKPRSGHTCLLSVADDVLAKSAHKYIDDNFGSGQSSSNVALIKIDLKDYVGNVDSLAEFVRVECRLDTSRYIFVFDHYDALNGLVNLHLLCGFSEISDYQMVVFCQSSFLSRFNDCSAYFSPYKNEQRIYGCVDEIAVGALELVRHDFPEDEMDEDVQEAKALSLQLMLQSHPLNAKRYVKDNAKIQLWVDAILSGGVSAQTLKRFYFSILKMGRKAPELSIAISNVITIMNRARISFSGFDLSDLDMQYADLDYLIAYRAQFDRSNLRYCSARGANLSKATFNGTIMEAMKFGELPSYSWPTGRVRQVLFSKDDRYVFAAGDDNTVIIYDAESGDSLTTIADHHQSVSNLALTSDGRYLITTSAKDKAIMRYDCVTQRSSHLFVNKNRDYSSHLNYFPVLLCDNDKSFLFSQETRASLRYDICKLPVRGATRNDPVPIGISVRDGLHQIGYVGAERWLGVVSGIHMTFAIYDLSDNSMVKSMPGYRFAVSRDNTLLAVAVKAENDIDQVHIYSLPEVSFQRKIIVNFASVRHSVSDFTGHIRDLLFLWVNNENILATAGDDGQILIWDVNVSIERPIERLLGHTHPVTTLACNSDGSKLISATGELSLRGHETGDRTIRQWDMTYLLSNRTTKAVHHGEIKRVFPLPHFNMLVSVGQDGNLMCWTLDSGQLIKTVHLFPNADEVRMREVRSACLIRQAKESATLLVANEKSKKIMVTVSKNLQVMVEPYDLESYRSYHMNVSFDQKYLIVSGIKTPASVFNFDTKEKLFDSAKECNVSAVYSSTAQSLAAFLNGNHLSLVGLPNGNEVFSTTLAAGHDRSTRGVGSVMFIPGTTILLASACYYVDHNAEQYEGVIYVIHYAQKKVLHTLSGHSDVIGAMSLSVDGRVLVSGDHSGMVFLWDVSSWSNLCKFKSYASKALICDIQFVNESSFVVGHSDGALNVWQIIRSADNATEVRLVWNTINRLMADQCVLENVKGLSASNVRLLKERNALNQADTKAAEDALWRARDFMLRDDYAGAIPHIKRAIALNSNFLPAYTMIGNAHMGVGKANEALHWYTMGIDKRLDHEADPLALRELYVARAGLYLSAGPGFAKQAKQDLNIALKIEVPVIPFMQAMRDQMILRQLIEQAEQHIGVRDLFRYVDDIRRFKMHFSSEHLHAFNSEGLTLLHCAVSRNCEEVTEFLLANGADPRIKDKAKNNNVFIQAVAGGASFNIVQMLVRHCPEVVNLPSGNGVYPIHWAANQGYANIIQLLVDHGANPNAYTEGMRGGKTPLYFAIRECQLSSVEVLLGCRAIPLKATMRGATTASIFTEKALEILAVSLSGRMTKKVYLQCVALEKIGRLLSDTFTVHQVEPHARDNFDGSLEQLTAVVERFGASQLANEDFVAENARRREMLESLGVDPEEFGLGSQGQRCNYM